MSEEQMTEAKRSPGRPPKLAESQSVGVKKGKTTWMPANISEVSNKEEGFRYRWMRKDPDNLAKKKLEGWEIVTGVTNPSTQVENGYGRINDGKQLTSTQERSDSILGRIPEDLAEQRDVYFNKESARRVQGLTAHLKTGMKKEGGNAPVHGEISISSRQGTQVIE